MAITAAVRSQPLPAPFVTAARRVDVLTEAVITVETDEGISGLRRAGYGWPSPATRPGLAVYAAEHIFAPLLVGRELTADVSECCEKALYGNPGAKAALDAAVDRALAASRGVPLCALLGGLLHRADNRSDHQRGRAVRCGFARRRRIRERVSDIENQARHRH